MSDDSLWERLKQSITPINRDDVSIFEKAQKPLKKTHIKPLTPKSTSTIASKREHYIQIIDRVTQRKINKGKIKIDGKLDLHGMSVAQAHTAFNAYIRQAVSQGKKHIIIVTGKGNREKGTGVIRRELPHWAQQQDIAHYIHSLSEPAQNKGRYIIILKRKRT